MLSAQLCHTGMMYLLTCFLSNYYGSLAFKHSCVSSHVKTVNTMKNSLELFALHINTVLLSLGGGSPGISTFSCQP